jgi:hypothetical protein
MPTKLSLEEGISENIKIRNLVETNSEKQSKSRKSDRIKEKVEKSDKLVKKEPILKKEVKPCSKLSINWRNFGKNVHRTKLFPGRITPLSESTTSSRIERVIPLEAQFIDHTNYTGKYRNMKPRHFLKVDKSPVHGFGLFAVRAIPKETFLIEYIGKIYLII